MAIAVKINTQNQQKVRSQAPISISTIDALVDVTIVEKNNNSTLVYNTATSKYEVKSLPVIFGGTF